MRPLNSRPKGKHKSRRKYGFDRKINKHEAEEVQCHDDGALSSGGDLSESISETSPPLLSIMTPITVTTPSNNSPVDNTPGEIHSMESAVAEHLLGYESWEQENMECHKDSTPPPISPTTGMIIVCDFVEKIDEDLSLRGEEQRIRDELQLKRSIDRGNRRRARRLKLNVKLLPRLRSRNLQTRARTFEKRRELGEARIQIIKADREYMKLLRENFIGQALGDDQLKLAYKRLQDARDLYGPLEVAYDDVEETLNREDFELEWLEEQALEHPSHLEDEGDNSDSASSSYRPDTSHANEELHPLYAQYMSALGDEGLLEEDYEDLMSRHNVLVEKHALRQKFQMDLHPDDQEILANFPAEKTELLAKMSEVATKVQLLHQECKAAGLLVEADNGGRSWSNGSTLDDSTSDLQEPSDDSIDMGRVSPAQSEYNRFPLLLEPPVEKPLESPDLSELSKSNILLSNFAQNNPGDRIACWLLHKLRSSCSEVELLTRLSPTVDGPGLEVNEDKETWQNQVLHLWFVDSANLSSSVYKMRTMSDGLAITEAVTFALMENETNIQPPNHPTSPSRITSLSLSPSEIPLPPSPPSLVTPHSPHSTSPSSCPLPTHHLPPSSSWTLEGIIAIYSQPKDHTLDSNLAKYIVDNTTSQRLKIIASTSKNLYLPSPEDALSNRLSDLQALAQRTLDSGNGYSAVFQDREGQNKKSRRRAMSV